MDSLVSNDKNTSDPATTSTCPPTRKRFYRKLPKRVGKGVKQRKYEKFYTKKNAEWEQARQEKQFAWLNSFRTDSLITNEVKSFNLKPSPSATSQTSTATTSSEPDDVCFEVTEPPAIIGISTTESIVHDLEDPPSLPVVSIRKHTPLPIYSNIMTVPCLLMDQDETHSLNYYSSYEQLIVDNPLPNTAASSCKRRKEYLQGFPSYGSANKIIINLSSFDGTPDEPFSGDSLIIYIPPDQNAEVEGVFALSSVSQPPLRNLASTGNKLCLITSDYRHIKYWHKLRSIAILYPMLQWCERFKEDFPPEAALFASLLGMTKGQILGGCLDFVT